LVWRLPDTLGTYGQVLTYNGTPSGQLEWITPSSGSGNWTSWTPSGSWSTNTTYTGMIRVHSNNIIDLQFNIATSGNPISANLTLNMHPSYTIDTTRMASSGPFTQLGDGNTSDNDVSGFTAKAFYLTTSTINLMYMDGAGVTTQITQAAPQTWGAGDSVNITIYGLPVTPV